MNPSPIAVVVRLLHVEIDGIAKYRQAHTVDNLAGFLLSDDWPHSEKTAPQFHQALAASIEAMEFNVDPETAREAFVVAAHANGMHVLPDDISDGKKTS